MKKHRYGELDALRGLAALAVVFFHYTHQYRGIYGHSIPANWDFKYGNYGVELFFILSGFVIYLTVKRVKTPFEFAYKRLTRLYPTYWWCLITTFIVVSIFSLPGKESTITEALVGLTMLQGLLDVDPVDDSYWSLLPELIFYSFMFLLIYYKQLKKINLYFSIWVLIMIINSFLKIPYITTVFNLRYGMLFFAGIIFYKLRTGNRSWINHLIIAYCFLAVLIVTREPIGIMIISCFFIIFYLVAFEKLNFLAKEPLIFFGKISYALYLLHQFIGYVIINYLRSHGIENGLLLIGTPLLINILLAWFTTDIIEKNAMKYLRNQYDVVQKIFFGRIIANKEIKPTDEIKKHQTEGSK